MESPQAPTIDKTHLPSMVSGRLTELHTLCLEFGVANLELFGSATGPSYDPLLSDLDFLVTYAQGFDYGPWLGRYTELRERLADLFRRRVDLVMASSIRNPLVLESINASRLTVFVA